MERSAISRRFGTASSTRAYFEALDRAVKNSVPKPVALVVNFPSNPTAQICDLAYAEIFFCNPPPSILEISGAKDWAVEFTSLSKTYSMPGWRMGFAVGNPDLIAALTRIKSYLDCDAFTQVQVADAAALNGPQDCIEEIRRTYHARRDVMVDAMCPAGWEILPSHRESGSESTVRCMSGSASLRMSNALVRQPGGGSRKCLPRPMH